MPASTILDIRSTLGSDSSEEEYETFLERLKKRAKVVLPHVGLVFLLVVYTLCGAGVFYVLERPNEVALRQAGVAELISRRLTVVSLFRNWSLSNMTEEVYDENARQHMKDFEVWLVRNFDQRHIIMEDVTDRRRDLWTVSSAVFFASTVITTIGYGHMAPMTLGGRIFCIFFGLFGIPLLLITIADIGKFLSDLITMMYRSYRLFKSRIRRKSRKISYTWVGRSSIPSTTSHSSPSSYTAETDINEMTIPVWIVLCFMSSYTAIGGVLFRAWEGWAYFDSFYFCFITMATIGFGDFVPTEETYMFLTMIYILIGLAVTTMCIDLAGTEYIRRIHYVGQKMENARELLDEGLHAGGDILKQAQDLIAMKNVAFLRQKGYFDGDEEFAKQFMEYMESDNIRSNVLYEPLSPKVRKILKPHIKVIPDEIHEEAAFILENKVYGQQIFPRVQNSHKIHHIRSPQERITVKKKDIMTESAQSESWPRTGRDESLLYIAPFILHESNV